MNRFAALFLLAVIALTGCALTPDYVRPELGLPDGWKEPADAGESIANLPWWDLYQDPQLRDLIEASFNENQDLAVALERIQEARENLTFIRADQFPFFDVFGSAGRGKQSQVVVPGARTVNTFSAMGQLSFEVDIWRRFSRASEAARADLLGTEAAYRNVKIGLVSAVATGYFVLRDLDARLAISRATVESRRGSLEIVKARFEQGTVPELDLNQAQIELSIAEAAVASFDRNVVQAENALRSLVGRFPGPIERGQSLEDQPTLPDVPPGLGVELLERRPDLVAAEQALISETAQIGVAEALRWPSISLTGSLGAVADELSDLTDDDAEAWDVSGGIFAPIFNSGQLKAQASAQRSRTEQALRSYEGTLRRAFREVEDSLVAVRTLREEHAARARQVVAARNAARLSRARYDAGLVDYLEVLDTERTLFNSELDESLVRQLALSEVAELYKALGGGWESPPAPTP